jgi:hypothetical protein
VLVSMVGALTVYVNGVGQFGARYWILAYPFLLLLMAEHEDGAEAPPIDRFAKILIVVSVVLITFQMWTIDTLGLF